jgi:hypothetical protein
LHADCTTYACHTVAGNCKNSFGVDGNDTLPLNKVAARLSRIPWIVAAALWLFGVLPIVLFGTAGGIFGDPQLWLVLLFVLAAAAATIIATVIFLIRRQWGQALSLSIAVALFLAASVGAVKYGEKYGDQIRWLALRPYYISQLEKAEPIGPYRVKSLAWRMGFDWMITLEYHESETDAHKWQQTQKDWHPMLRQKLIQLEPHYFLNAMNW